MNEIINEARKRNITTLIHFTNEKNLKSIIENGILSKDTLDNRKMAYYYNDEYRFDNLSDTISLSVTFPNYKMFYRLRKENVADDWVVILIDAEKVLSKPCAFCYDNAANSGISVIPLRQRMSVYAFNEMFSDDIFGYKRAEMGLSENETTSPQAEILAFEHIPINAIKCIVFEEDSVRIKYMSLLNRIGIKSIVYEHYYYPRHDFQFWQNDFLGENNGN